MCDRDHSAEDQERYEALGLITRKQFGVMLAAGVAMLLPKVANAVTVTESDATVKTPDGYPGGPGMHAQFVTAGPAFTVDISHARVLLPDGRQTDKRPLAVGDRVLMGGSDR